RVPRSPPPRASRPKTGTRPWRVGTSASRPTGPSLSASTRCTWGERDGFLQEPARPGESVHGMDRLDEDTMKRLLGPLLVLSSAAAFTACLICLYEGMRHVMRT